MNRIELRFLGTGDAFGSGGRLQTCFHLSGGGGDVLIDCGATALIALKRTELKPNDIGCVLLTHLHGDHFGGLPFFILDAQFSHRTTPLAIAGPPGVATRLEAAMEALYPGSAGKQRAFEVTLTELEPRTPVEVGPARVTAFPVLHPSGAPAYALRVEYGGKITAYSGDTEWTDALVEAALDADVFLCECCFWEPKARYHLDHQTLKQKRPLLDCRRLLLTHLGKEMHEHLKRTEFEVAEEGGRIVL